jgi:UDP-N-acetylmuramoyl-tripeptide--D-alanyl-D-alanine ligase
LLALMQLLAATPGYQRRLVAAGEMLELGDSSEELHRECGQAAAGLCKIDWIFGVQGYAADFVDAAIKAGHPRDRAIFFQNSQEASKFLEQFVEPGDLLLLKGSRGVRMERILEAIDVRRRRVSIKHAAEAMETGSKGRN